MPTSIYETQVVVWIILFKLLMVILVIGGKFDLDSLHFFNLSDLIDVHENFEHVNKKTVVKTSGQGSKSNF